MPVIILAIKSIFLSGADSYNLGRKPYTSHFFLLFCGEIIRVVCAILIVAIEDLEMQFGNLNLPLGKNTIWFELLAQKLETDKKTTNALYYQY